MALDIRMWIDLGVLAFYFVTIVTIGLTLGKRDTNLEGFALGGRRIPWWAVLASIIAAETSAGTFLGTPGEGFSLRNYTYLQLVIGTILARVIVAFIFIKPYYQHNVYSIYEYLTVRFGTGTKNAASAIFLVTRVLASGTRLYVAAIVFAVAFDLLTGTRPTPGQQLAIYLGSIILMTVLTALYTTIGGIKAVIWTDMIQAVIMLGSALCAIGILLWLIPGHWSGVRAVLNDFEQVTLFASGTQPDAGFWNNLKAVLNSEYTIWAALIGSTFTTMATHGTDQDMVQRMLTAKDYKRSRLSLITSGLADIPIVFVFLSIGILLSVFYQLRPDPGLPEKTNEIFAYFILKEMPVGLRGLLIAGIFATAMGSLSAALNALATSFTRDWYLPWRKDPPTDQETVSAARRFTALFAVLMIGVAGATAYFVILHPGARIIPIALGIFGYTYGCLLGVFLLGMLTKTRGRDLGNYIAMAAGFVVVAVLSELPNQILEMLGLPKYHHPDWLPKISFVWRIFFGTVTTFTVAALFQKKPDADGNITNG
jgi:SSS family solute:Na+ symporter